MRKLNFFMLLAFVLISFSNCQPSTQKSTPEEKPAKYVFFFIGDGMGLGHVALTESYTNAIEGKIGFNPLGFSQFPISGSTTTYAKTRLITDSAAAGTAMASGSKTSVGTIGLGVQDTDTLWSVARAAKLAGKKVGILTSVSINHATPAVFYAHTPKRSMYYEIATQMGASNFDVFGGGGIKHSTGAKKDTTDAYELLQQAGYKYVNTVEGMNKLTTKDGKVYMVAPRILKDAEMPYVIDRQEGDPTLADFTRKAIELLENPNGFFMMVEGGKIDWAAHGNDAACLVQEVQDFDAAIDEALTFYEKHPDETLIVVTADHETGGLVLGNTSMHYESNLKIIQNQKQSINLISEAMNKQNLELKSKKYTLDMAKADAKTFFGLEDLTEIEIEGVNKALVILNKHQTEETEYSEVNPLSMALMEILSARAGIGWSTHFHTATPVPVKAIGTQSALFEGNYDNTDLPKKMAKIMAVDF